MTFPPTFCTACFTRSSMLRGNLRCWTTTIVRSTSLANTDASLTPRIGGLSTNTRSKRCLTSWINSDMRRELRIPAASAGRMPEGMKNRLSTGVWRITSSSIKSVVR